MSARRYKYDDPREWLNRARSSLQHARATDPPVYLEELCSMHNRRPKRP